MPLPKDWSALFDFEGSVSQVHMICPHCALPSTFETSANFRCPRIIDKYQKMQFHLLLRCNSVLCKKVTYVITTRDLDSNRQTANDNLDRYPSPSVPNTHPAVPLDIAADWLEANRAMNANAPKAAAVMCRRVLYGVLQDKGCKLKPLYEGFQLLINQNRLPAIFDGWLDEIKNDGHDAAHPDRALNIKHENVVETLEYTSELLRFIYIEPYNFQQRLARNT